MRLVDEDNVRVVDGREGKLVDQRLSDASHGVRMPADALLQDGTRSLALAEALEIALGDVREELLRTIGDFLYACGDGEHDLLALPVILAHRVFHLHGDSPWIIESSTAFCRKRVRPSPSNTLGTLFA